MDDEVGFRVPNTMPKCLPEEHRERLMAMQGAGRGRMLQEASAAAGLKSAGGGVNKIGYEQWQEQMQRYIPGLTQPPPDDVIVEPEVKKVPPELLQSFLDGTKNPVSAVMEYCAISKLTPQFREVTVTSGSITFRFGSECTIGDKVYPQGSGTTKKGAKTDAASKAFKIIVGLENDDSQPVAPSSQDTPAPDPSIGDSPATFGSSMTDKNPVGLLALLCRKHKIHYTAETTDKVGPNGFGTLVRVNGHRVALEYDSSKRDSKRRAAEQAIQVLMAFEQPTPFEKEGTHFDEMAKLANRKLFSLLDIVDLAVCRKLAAFIVKRGQADKGEVVALATGNTHIESGKITKDGHVLLDSHSIVLARRTFIKYLYKELKCFYEGKPSIFQRGSDSDKLRLKDDISIHLYTSSAACGDGAVFTNKEKTMLTDEELHLINQGVHQPTFDDPIHGLLRVKCTQDGTKVAPEVEPGETNTETMTCSDKLLQWNILGLQGALLSCFVEPIYMSSMTLGYQYEHGHIVRAVCCRVYDELADALPGGPGGGYRVNHPYVGRTTMYVSQRSADQYIRTCVNWCQSDGPLLELVDAQTGRATNRPNGASHLCKAAFLFRFRKIVALSKLTDTVGDMSAAMYADCKQKSAEYQQAKHVFLEHVRANGFGQWSKRSKENEMFTE